MLNLRAKLRAVVARIWEGLTQPEPLPLSGSGRWNTSSIVVKPIELTVTEVTFDDDFGCPNCDNQDNLHIKLLAHTFAPSGQYFTMECNKCQTIWNQRGQLVHEGTVETYGQAIRYKEAPDGQ